MTKLKTLLAKAKKELQSEKEVAVLNTLKESLLRVEECRKTLKKLEKEHNELLNIDLDEVEIEDWEY
jgi:hypothetical protein